MPTTNLNLFSKPSHQWARFLHKLNALLFSIGVCLLHYGYAAELERAPLSHTAKVSAPAEIKHFKVADFINAVAWSPDGNLLAALSGAGRFITIWDAKTGKVVKSWERYGGAYSGNSFGFSSNTTVLTSTPNGKSPDPRYAELTPEFALMEWDIRTGKVLRYLPDRMKNPEADKVKVTSTFTVSADQSSVAGISGNKVVVFSTESGQLRFPPVGIYTPWEVQDHEELLTSIAFSPDGKELAIGTGIRTNYPETGGGKVYFYEAQTGKQLRSIFIYPKNPKTEDTFRVESLVYSPDGQYLATGKSKIFNLKENNLISVDLWETKTGRHVASLGGKTISLLPGVTENFGGPMPLTWYGNTLTLGEGPALFFWSVPNPKAPAAVAVVDPTPNSRTYLYSTAVSKHGVLAATLDNKIRLFQLSKE